MKSAAPTLSLFALAAGLTGCASTAATSTQTGDGNDCAVIAAVAKEHYELGPDRPAPPLWLFSEDGRWKPDCDWGRHGLSFPATYDPDVPPQRDANGRPRLQWIQFSQPRYDGQGATIEAGIMHGPLAGIGVECRLRSGVAGWTVSECRNTWIS